MDYESISENGHQLSRPLHQDNANITTLHISHDETTMKSKREKKNLCQQAINRFWGDEKNRKREKSVFTIHALIRRHEGLIINWQSRNAGFERELNGGVIN